MTDEFEDNEVEFGDDFLRAGSSLIDIESIAAIERSTANPGSAGWWTAGIVISLFFVGMATLQYLMYISGELFVSQSDLDKSFKSFLFHVATFGFSLWGRLSVVGRQLVTVSTPAAEYLVFESKDPDAADAFAMELRAELGVRKGALRSA